MRGRSLGLSFIFTFILNLTIISTLIAEVRLVPPDTMTMHKVRLVLGRSTVIRLPGKALKVILGNQNFFKVEFSGRDLAVKPLAIQSSNMFVYTEDESYGFVLETLRAPPYDDLIVVSKDPGSDGSMKSKMSGLLEQSVDGILVYSEEGAKVHLLDVVIIEDLLVLSFDYRSEGTKDSRVSVEVTGTSLPNKVSSKTLNLQAKSEVNQPGRFQIQVGVGSLDREIEIRLGNGDKTQVYSLRRDHDDKSP